jgi:hypothetical protein
LIQCNFEKNIEATREYYDGEKIHYVNSLALLIARMMVIEFPFLKNKKKIKKNNNQKIDATKLFANNAT